MWGAQRAAVSQPRKPAGCPAWLQGYKPPDEGPSEYQTIPLDKIEDFGVHCKQVSEAHGPRWAGRAAQPAGGRAPAAAKAEPGRSRAPAHSARAPPRSRQAAGWPAAQPCDLSAAWVATRALAGVPPSAANRSLPAAC